MTVQSIALHDRLTGTPQAIHEAPRTTSLAGRSAVPCPPKLLLTDTQIKKVCLVAFALFAAVLAPAIIGALTFSAVGAVPAAAMAFSGALLAGIIIPIWPEMDYQSPEQAAIIRKDLQTKTLKALAAKYDFFELAGYGYISRKSAEKMQQLNAMRPHYYLPQFVDGHLMYFTNQDICRSAAEAEDYIAREFHQLRSQNDFIS